MHQMIGMKLLMFLNFLKINNMNKEIKGRNVYIRYVIYETFKKFANDEMVIKPAYLKKIQIGGKVLKIHLRQKKQLKHLWNVIKHSRIS